MSTSQALKVAASMTNQEMAVASKQTAAEAGPGTVKRFFESNKATIMALLPQHVGPDRMLKLALGALRTTPKLAQATNASLLGAVVTCSQLGLEPNTPLGHAYLLPFDKNEKINGQWVKTETQVQVIIGYKGMLDLARRSGQIISIAAHEVCKNDKFRYAYGLEEELLHQPSIDNRGDVIAFYAVAKLVGGGYAFEVMGRAEVDTIRDNAATKNRAKKDGDGRPIITGPWKDSYIEMGRKTALRRLFKYLPISIEMLSNSMAIDGQAVGNAMPLDDAVFMTGVDQSTGEIFDHDDDRKTMIEDGTKGPLTSEVVPEALATEVAAKTGKFEPTPAEIEAIAARERAEAAAQQPGATTARRRTRTDTNME